MISISTSTSDHFLSSYVPFDSLLSFSSSWSFDDLSSGSDSDSGLGPRFGCPFSSLNSYVGLCKLLRQQLLPPSPLPLKLLRASQPLVFPPHAPLPTSSR